MIEDKHRMLGRTPSPKDSRTLQLLDYWTPRSPTPPDKRLWQIPISQWGVMGNDTWGNCTFVTAAHEILAWRANELQDTRRITDEAVIQLAREYGALNGFNILDRLKIWRKQNLWATSLWAFAEINSAIPTEIRVAIDSFGCADIGVNLPLAWRNADTWDTGSGRSYRPGSWGGHSVPLVGYDPECVYAVSWGQVIPMSWEALQTYCDEAYALITPDWLAADSITPSGYDLTSLHADLNAITR